MAATRSSGLQRSVAAIVLWIVSVAFAPFPAAAAGASDEAETRAVAESWVSAVRNGAEADLVQLHHSNARLYCDGPGRVDDGAAAIAEYLLGGELGGACDRRGAREGAAGLAVIDPRIDRHWHVLAVPHAYMLQDRGGRVSRVDEYAAGPTSGFTFNRWAVDQDHLYGAPAHDSAVELVTRWIAAVNAGAWDEWIRLHTPNSRPEGYPAWPTPRWADWWESYNDPPKLRNAEIVALDNAVYVSVGGRTSGGSGARHLFALHTTGAAVTTFDWFATNNEG